MPDEVRAAVREFVARRPDARVGARAGGAARPAGARAQEKVHLVAVPLLSLPFLPLVLLAAPFFAILLRLHEKRDESPHVKPDEERVRRAGRARGPRRPEPVHRGRPREAVALPAADAPS